MPHYDDFFGAAVDQLQMQFDTSAVPDLCIASTNLLSLIDPLPMDRLSRHIVAAVCSWPAVDRHHAAHLANCASADDDEIALMSAELLPRLEGGIRAALDEVDTL